MNTLPENHVQCYLCNTVLRREMAANWKGHPVHSACAESANACRAAGVSPEPGTVEPVQNAAWPRPVPRVEPPHPPVWVNLESGKGGAKSGCPHTGCCLPAGHPGDHEAAEGSKFPQDTFGRLVFSDQGKSPEIDAAFAAVATLGKMGYTWSGGALWTAPVDPRPAACGTYCSEGVCVLEKGHTTDHLFKPVHLPPGPGDYSVNSFFNEVMMRIPGELLGPDCPNHSDIISETRFILELLLTKNRAYGSSFKSGLNVFSKLSPVEAINARMDDKLARIKQAKDFSEDTELDLIGYLILKRIAQKLEENSHEAHVEANLRAVQRVASMDPAFSGADKTVFQSATVKGDELTYHDVEPLPTAEEMMAVAKEPACDHFAAGAVTVVDEKGNCRKCGQQVVQMVFEGAQDYYGCPCGVTNQWGKSCPQCGMTFLSRAQWLAITKEGYCRAHPTEPASDSSAASVPAPAAPSGSGHSEDQPSLPPVSQASGQPG